MNGVMLKVHHLHHADAGSIGQMVDCKQKTEQGQGLVQDGGAEFSGTGGLFMFFQKGLLFGGFFRCQFLMEYVCFFSQSETASFALKFRR